MSEVHMSNEAFHLRVKPGQVGHYAILPGDPGRCEKIAAYLKDARQISYNREFNVWTGLLDGETVCVCSTGIGGPSAAIAVEELAACGVHTVIRIGTCGGIALPVEAGDTVIASGAVRQEGTSLQYAPPEYPAVADASVLFALRQAAKTMGFRTHIGVVQSKDSFYGQHSPDRMPVASALREKWNAWKALGVLASEMETAAIFVVAASLGVRAGAVFHVLWNQERVLAGLDSPDRKSTDTDSAIRVALEALRKR